MITNNFQLSLQQSYMGYQEGNFTVVQNDTLVNALIIRIFNGNTEVDYSQITSGTITFVKNDFNTVQGNLTINSNNITYEMGTNEIAIPGSVKASVQLYGSAGERLTPAMFRFKVEADLVSSSAVESTTEFPILQQLLTSVQNTVEGVNQAISDVADIGSNEDQRISAEETREQNETLRISAETTRQTNESQRGAAEANRISAETTRQSNETAREASIADIENRFTQLTTAQQQSSEVINARSSTVKSTTFGSLDERLEGIETDNAGKMARADFDTHVADSKYQTAGGTATAITLTIGETLSDGLPVNFKCASSNGGAATTINTKPFYKPGGTLAPNLIAGKYYTAIYNAAGTCFFFKASAGGNTVAAHVLAGDTFSNDSDCEIVGTMPNRAGDNNAVSYHASGTSLHIIPQQGYTDGVDDAAVITDANFIASNIKYGVSVLGQTGTHNSINNISAGETNTIFNAGVDTYSTSNTSFTATGPTITTHINGTIRVKFEITSGSSTATAYGRIYKNSSPIGISRSMYGYNNPIEYVEDFACSAGDVFQAYLYSSSGLAGAFIHELKVVINETFNPVN